MKEKQVYLFEKDGSYKVVNIDKGMDRIGYYNHDNSNNPCWQPNGDYIQYREPVKDWLEVKTLTKIVSIDSYSLEKGLVEGASLVKDNLNYGQCTGSYEKAMGFGRDYRLELNYVVVKDSPLHTIITELEKSSKSSNDKDVKYQKDINALVGKIRKLEKCNSDLVNKHDSNTESLLKHKRQIVDLNIEIEESKDVVSKPSTSFLYLVFLNWLKNLFFIK